MEPNPEEQRYPTRKRSNPQVIYTPGPVNATGRATAHFFERVSLEDRQKRLWAAIEALLPNKFEDPADGSKFFYGTQGQYALEGVTEESLAAYHKDQQEYAKKNVSTDRGCTRRIAQIASRLHTKATCGPGVPTADLQQWQAPASLASPSALTTQPYLYATQEGAG